MPTWKKLVVSGSNISQLVNDINYVQYGDSSTVLSGSFSGSFYGDGSNITNVTATSIDYTNVTNKPTLVSGSTQIDITAVDGYSSFSSSIDAHLDANISVVNTTITNVSSSAHSQRIALYNDLDTSITNLSASAATANTNIYNSLSSDITNLSSSAADANNSLSASFASSLSGLSQTLSVSGSTGDADIDLKSQDLSIVGDGGGITTSVSGTTVTIDSNGLVSGSSQIDITGTTGYAAFSSSIDNHLDANISAVNTSISNVSSSAHSQRLALYNDLDTNITNLSSSAHSQRTALYNDLGSDITNLSSSSHTQRTALYNDLDTNITNLSSSAHSHRNTLISNLSSSAHTANVQLSSSFATTIVNQGTDVTNLILSQSEFDVAFNLSGTSVTVLGDLTVSGTTTYVDSQTIQLGDNIIELTGTGSNFAGLLVNDNSGPQSGSLLWDAVNNYWIAGGEGSETKILLSEGDNVVSSSVQITLGDTTGYTAYSSSVATSITNLSSSAATANTNLSASFASTVSGLSQTLTVSGDTGTDGIDLKTETLNVNGDGGGISTAIDASTNTISLVSNGVISGSSQITGDLNVDSINATSITGSSGNITNLYVTTGDVTNLTSTDATVTNLGGTNVNVTNITGSAANITNITNNTFNSVDATITNIGGTNVNVTNITGSSAEITNITVTDGSITNITGTNVNVTNITGSAANITNIEGDSVNVTNITGSSISVGDITTTGDVNIGGDVTTNNFYATSITGSVISGSVIYGDGSNLFNITVDQASTISSTFTNVSTKTVTHNFNSRNIQVVVYDTDYNMIIPASVNLNSLDQATITFCSASSGTVVVMKGGHIVSGSISADNIDGLDVAINNYLDLDGVVSSSVQIDIEQTTNYTAFSSSIDTHLDALILALSSSVDTHLDASITNISNSIDVAYKAADSALSSSFASTIANLSSTLAISGSTGNDVVNLVNDSLTVSGTAGEIETTVTDNQIQIGIVTDPTLTGNVTVTGNLTVQGDTIQAQVANLNVEDRFILLNSGSNSGDAGIIFGGSDGTANEGSGIFWDSPANVFGYASGISSTDVSSTHVAKLGYIQQDATAVPTAAPSFQGVGAIHIKEDTGCIYVYA